MRICSICSVGGSMRWAIHSCPLLSLAEMPKKMDDSKKGGPGGGDQKKGDDSKKGGDMKKQGP